MESSSDVGRTSAWGPASSKVRGASVLRPSDPFGQLAFAVHAHQDIVVTASRPIRKPWLAIAVPLALTACGDGSSPCAAKPKCANDPVPTQAAIDACQQRASDSACGSEFSTLASCIYETTACDASGHSLFNDRTKCAVQTSAFGTCCARHPDSVACGG
jgi:hypothetical protein